MKIELPESLRHRGPEGQPSTIDSLVAELGLKTDAARMFLCYALENAILFDKKQQDYGSANIARSGALGCVIRMGDKFERVFHLFMNKHRRTVNESIKDSFRDFSNYAIIALMCEDGHWPGVGGDK